MTVQTDGWTGTEREEQDRSDGQTDGSMEHKQTPAQMDKWAD